MKNVIMLGLFVCASLVSCDKKLCSSKKFIEETTSLYDLSLRPFYHGVASGDPLNDRVIIWTRVTPDEALASILVQWEISQDKNFSTIIKSGTITTTPEKDYTVKVDVNGLQPNRTYYYRFNSLEKTSTTGKTKTAPVTSDSVKFAVVSCSNWEFGYFNAYDRIAEKELDAVIHLGDYIYEYGPGSYGDTTIGRKHLPPYEIVSLSDYRTRYSQYHLDQGLRNTRANHPFITIWDDHEIANNVYKEGAQNHQPEKEGDFNERKEAARQAYYEWLPIREGDSHYRKFSFGNLLDLIMLDERLEGRKKPVDSISDITYHDPSRTMLGEKQIVWFEENLKNSTAAWKVIGNQVIFSDVSLATASPNTPRNLDSWDGYPAEKKRIKDFIVNNTLKDILLITGDTHASWAIEVSTDVNETYDPKTSKGSFAIELGTTSVSSGNGDERHSPEDVQAGESALLKVNPHIKYLNNRDHGYLLLTLYPTNGKAEWYYVTTLRKIDDEEYLGKKIEFEKGSCRLK